ncbi:MAG: ABC transporter ATP-binding protein [Thermomicrobium sp.]|nr:ABC transporter ATP-binding protein [Thermomicrobium sp.]
MPEPILELQQVSVHFRRGRVLLRAVEDISFQLGLGDVLCLVGESGSGKTTLGKVVAGLLRPTVGVVRYRGQDVWRLDSGAFRRFRRAVQIVHQDPYASLNPIRTVVDTLVPPLLHHRIARNRSDAIERAARLLELVDLVPPEQFLPKYPHQLSGGQRQRVSIARALTVQPELIVADEATSMVAVSIRVSLLNTLRRLREELGVAFLFITHDLAMAKYFAWQGRIAVLYLGRVVELGPTPSVIGDPLHPYTQALLAALPEPDPDLTRRKSKLLLRSLDIPSLAHLPSGCPFHPRCLRFVSGLCDVERPSLRFVDAHRSVACHVVVQERAAGDLPPSSQEAATRRADERMPFERG